MAEFTSYDPERVEVLGEVIESFVLAFPDDLRHFGLSVLENHGVRDADPTAFYKAQPLLQAMRDIAQPGKSWHSSTSEPTKVQRLLRQDGDREGRH